MNEDAGKTYWQDIASLCAGIWLMLTLWFEISTGTASSAWLAYGGGAVIAALAAGGFQDNSPLLAWLAAGVGLLAAATPWIAGITADSLATWTLVAGGGSTVIFSTWSALAKRTAPAPQPQLAAAE